MGGWGGGGGPQLGGDFPPPTMGGTGGVPGVGGGIPGLLPYGLTSRIDQ